MLYQSGVRDGLNTPPVRNLFDAHPPNGRGASTEFRKRVDIAFPTHYFHSCSNIELALPLVNLG